MAEASGSGTKEYCFGWLDSLESSDDEREFHLSWMTSEDWLESDSEQNIEEPTEKKDNPSNKTKSQLEPVVLIERDPYIENLVRTTALPATKPHRNAKAFMRRLFEVLGQKDLKQLLKTDQAIKFVKENYKTHALRNAFIYLTAAVKKCGAPQKEIDDAVQEYRSERRKVDDYRYGNNQGFSKFESAFYEDNYSKSFKICNREITTLEKLLEGQETRVNLNQKKYMHHWAKCTQQLAVMMAADVGCWQTNRLKYDEMQYMRKSSRGYVIEHKDKKLQFRTNSASILVRYCILRKYVKVRTDKVLVNIRGTQYKVRVPQEKNQTLLRETCSVCEKKIASKSHLKIHMRLHTGEKPYQCTNCNARFRDRSNFNKHKMTHEAETGSEDDSA